MYDVVQAFFFAVVDGSYAPAEAELVDQAFFFTENEQRRFGPVAAEHKCGVATLGHAYECCGMGIVGQFAGIVTDGIAQERRGVGLWCQYIFPVVIEHCFFYFPDNICHGLYHQQWISPGGGFGTQHHCIGAFHYGIGHVAYLTTVGLGAVQHALHHLCGHDYRLGPVHTFFNNVFLYDGHSFYRHFHTQVSTGYHDAITFYNNVADVP